MAPTVRWLVQTLWVLGCRHRALTGRTLSGSVQHRRLPDCCLSCPGSARVNVLASLGESNTSLSSLSSRRAVRCKGRQRSVFSVGSSGPPHHAGSCGNLCLSAVRGSAVSVGCSPVGSMTYATAKPPVSCTTVSAVVQLAFSGQGFKTMVHAN